MNSPSEVQVDAATLPTFLVGESAVAPLEYRLVAAEGGAGAIPSGSGGYCVEDGMGSGVPPTREQAAREFADRVEASRVQGLQQGLQEGIRRTRADLEGEMLAMVNHERDRILRAVEGFRGAQERYFGDVEREVVRLALAIAARVLHREAQFDGLMLAGAVRVALEKLADTSGVVLRTAEIDVGAWEQLFAGASAAERPTVLGDARLARGECVLETTMGTVELGVKAQLAEIEQGFFDLLQHRPGR